MNKPSGKDEQSVTNLSRMQKTPFLRPPGCGMIRERRTREAMRLERRKFLAILLLATLIIGIYFLFERGSSLTGLMLTLWSILMPFFLGGVLAFVLNVPMRFLERRVLFFMDRSPRLRRAQRPVAMVLVLALVVGVVYVIMSIVVPELINTILSVIKAIPAALARLDELIEPYGFSVSQVLSASFTVPSVSDVDAKIADMVNLLLKGAAFSTTVIGTVYQNVLSFFFTVMFTIYFLSSKERLRSQVKKLMRAYLKPRWVEKALSVADLSQRTFSSFITGQCLEACILGGMFFVTMTLLGMPYVLLISVFIAVTALIPVIGAWMGCIVGAILILVNNPLQALGFVALFLVLQQIEGNLIYPHVMGNAIGLPSIWVLFAVLLGEGLMGILGMLLFIPLTSVCYTLLHEQVHKRLGERAASGG